VSGDLTLVNARLILPEIGELSGELAIRDGRVSEVGPDGSVDRAGEVVDVHGHYVLPGFLDPHVHSGLLPPVQDRLQAESAFAASGGITTIIRYFRRTDSYLDTFPAQVEMGVAHHYQDFAHHLALFTSEQVEQMERTLHRFGVTSFKIYMNLKGGFGKNFLMDLRPEAGDRLETADVDFDDGHLYDIFRTATGLPRVRINVHSENAEIVSRQTEYVRASGLEGLPAWHSARPGNSEALAIQMVATLSNVFNVPVYYPHIGSAEAIAELRKVRAQGVDYAAETGPQYVALNTASPAGALAKVMPPVRTEHDVQEVWKGIDEGLLTCLGSDHIAYTSEEKQAGSIWTTRPAFGGTGLTLPVFLSEGVNRGRLTLQHLVRIGSYQTARAFGLYPRKGTLLPGSDGDFVVVDPDKEWTVRASDLLSASDFSAYEGMTLRGSVEMTGVRGTIVYREGEMTGSPGLGRYYRRFPQVEAVDSVSS
jgi:dihydropyrimidinase